MYARWAGINDIIFPFVLLYILCEKLVNKWILKIFRGNQKAVGICMHNLSPAAFCYDNSKSAEPIAEFLETITGAKDWY